MFSLSSDTRLSDLIRVYNVVPNDICNNVIKKSDNLCYNKHYWNDVYDKSYQGDAKDFERAEIDKASSHLLTPYINDALYKYAKDINLVVPFSGRSSISLNRYPTGSRMKTHVDHIRSIFEGDKKGIPVLSVLGLLNDDFKGGEFLFWDICDYNLKAGDVIIFPSVFMYPHVVTEITEGVRYSFVLWIY